METKCGIKSQSNPEKACTMHAPPHSVQTKWSYEKTSLENKIVKVNRKEKDQKTGTYQLRKPDLLLYSTIACKSICIQTIAWLFIEEKKQEFLTTCTDGVKRISFDFNDKGSMFFRWLSSNTDSLLPKIATENIPLELKLDWILNSMHTRNE
jgi:hypothetical protein